jgi:hypothetical protein
VHGAGKPVAAVFDKDESEVARLLAIGVNYATVARLSFKGKPLCEENSSGKWMCLVRASRTTRASQDERPRRRARARAGRDVLSLRVRTCVLARARPPLPSRAGLAAPVRDGGAAQKAHRAV